ncbi:MAG TPA: CYCXC family (seleno)protein [Pyrinomonadaceae bacterium]|jgi:hypothetical protein
MKTKIFLALLLSAGVLLAACGGQAPTRTGGSAVDSGKTARSKSAATPVPQVDPMTAQRRARVPRYLESASLGGLPPTLQPEQFIGPTREAYRVVREIPQTIAQLPCYCHCDMSLGHKSLHSCFEDTHASQCAVCVGEALEAYDLQKRGGLTPTQIRERIIAEYSVQQ